MCGCKKRDKYEVCQSGPKWQAFDTSSGTFRNILLNSAFSALPMYTAKTILD